LPEWPDIHLHWRVGPVNAYPKVMTTVASQTSH